VCKRSRPWGKAATTMWLVVGEGGLGRDWKGFAMKIIKLLLVLVILVVLLLVISGFALVSYVDTLARRGIEKGGTYALGVDTTLGGADVGIMGGTFAMNDLKVANVAGFPGPHFLSLGDGSVAVAFNTLREETVVLPHLKLDAIDVRLEKKDGGTNYGVILENLKKVSGGSGDKPAPQPEPKKDEKRFVVNDLSITKVTVHVDLMESGGPGAALIPLTKVTIPINEIKLQNVGKTGQGVAGSGVTMSELANIIVQAVLAAAVENGGGLIPADILGDLQGRLAALGDLSKLDMKVLGDVKGTVENLTKQADEAKKTVEDAVEKGKSALDEAKKGLEGLIPKKKEDK